VETVYLFIEFGHKSINSLVNIIANVIPIQHFNSVLFSVPSFHFVLNLYVFILFVHGTNTIKYCSENSKTFLGRGNFAGWATHNILV